MTLSIAHTIKKMLPAGSSVTRIYRSGPGTQVALARDHVARGRTVVLLLPAGTDHALYAALADLLTPGDRDKPFWERTWISFPPYPPGQEDARAWGARWASLFSLTEPVRGRGILLPVGNLFARWPSRSVVQEEHFYLIPGEELDPETLLERLAGWGYERVSMVGKVGEMALRGDIMDICCPGYRHPLRIEFFGDVVENVRLFEPLSQRSIGDLEQGVIVPVASSLQQQPYIDQAEALWKGLTGTGELSPGAAASLRQQLHEGGLIPPGLFYEDAQPISAWLPEDPLFLLVDANDLRPKMEEVEWGWKGYFQNHCPGWPRQGVVRTMGDARETWEGAGQILFENLVIGQDRDGIALAEKSVAGFEDLFWEPEKRRHPWRTLMQEIGEWRKTRNQVLLCFHSEQSRRKFLKIAQQDRHEFFTTYVPDQRGIYALVAPLNRGMDLEWARTLILPEDVLQPGAVRERAVRDAGHKFVGLKRFDDLVPDDLLVHRDHGLCRFGGLHRVKIGDVANDYLLLFFARDDKLYLPVDRLGLVQRYSGPEGSAPALDRLGGAGWQKTRSRVRKAVEKIAQDLVAMYAWRKVAKGFTYKPVPRDYWEFEASFGFEETPDQDKAIREVLEDMDRPEPMDRLVCGDVGFGKTEVAMRAAMRAVLDGRQVALLCPTTVLAEQHYRNFRRRMEEEFGVRVGLLSRFVPRKTQKLLLEATARGEVDILIGTHRLLSADVHLPNLALLILDEEQRFGVKHKEQLKRLRKDIDVLTLTATPIPRTLQLSLSGIRGLSVIETAPVDRKPVQTSLMERDPAVLRSILERELGRGGQVFWVYNRVRGLEQVRDFVAGLVPEARIGMGHGKMGARELEETMHSFWHGELDILVCTSIVESGLDFPRANTLIVDQAQLFGLGQLYQLRGRVGRSSEQAYACFLVPDVSRLEKVARRRMQIILEMDYLGAGFQVAMEDLRLRGAGNILGESQSGQIGKVGLDLFLEMLDEEVRALQGKPLEERVEPELNISFAANIPEGYMVEASERLRYYKALSSCTDKAQLQELLQEIEDRFGPIPEELQIFHEVLVLKQVLRGFGVSRADLLPNRVILTWPDASDRIDPERLVAWVASNSRWVGLLPPSRLELRMDGGDGFVEGLRRVIGQLEAAGFGAGASGD